jgi:hypothetical protein
MIGDAPDVVPGLPTAKAAQTPQTSHARRKQGQAFETA